MPEEKNFKKEVEEELFWFLIKLDIRLIWLNF
jgi:hypothetical protein